MTGRVSPRLVIMVISTLWKRPMACRGLQRRCVSGHRVGMPCAVDSVFHEMADMKRHAIYSVNGQPFGASFNEYSNIWGPRLDRRKLHGRKV